MRIRMVAVLAICGLMTGMLSAQEKERQELLEVLTAGGIPVDGIEDWLYLDNDRDSYLLTVRETDPVNAWKRVRDAVADAKYFPVLMGPPETTDLLAETAGWFDGYPVYFGDAERRIDSIDEEYSAAEQWDAKSYLELARKGLNLPVDHPAWAPSEALKTSPRSLIARPQDTPEGDEESPVRAISIALIPADDPWEVPLLLGFGGVRYNPSAAVHGMILRSWAERFGAQVLGMSADEIEIWVEKPPARGSAEAKRVAEEHLAYCPDWVLLEGGSVASQAGLASGSTWYFWWHDEALTPEP